MTVKIEIETDNAAFGDDPEIEVARILLELSKDLRNFRVSLGGVGFACRLRDVNGNTVGKVTCE